MFDSLARLANGRAKRVGLLALVFFLLAGAVGGSVADRLDPYGADDPDTETVQAKERLQDAGLRVPAVIAVVQDAPVAKPATRARVEALERQVRERPDVASVTGFYDTRSTAFVSNDGQSTYFAVALKPTEDKPWQEAGAEIADELSERARRPRRRRRRRPGAGQQAGRGRPEKGRAARLPAALPALAALLPQPRRLGPAADDRRPGDRRHLPHPPLASEVGSISIFALNLTTALGLGLAIDYSLFIVSRYREEIAKSGPGLEAMRRVLATAGRTVFFSSLTVSAALASLLVFPQRFLYSMGLGGALVALFAALISLTVLPAVLTLLGIEGQRRRAELPPAPGRGRRAARRARLLVPALALRDAAADAGRDLQRALPDRPRPALPADQVRHRRPDRAAGVGQRPPGLRHGQHRRSRPTARRRSGSTSKAAGRRRRRTVRGRRCAGSTGSREVQPPQRLERGRDRPAGRLRPTPSSPRPARRRCNAIRDLPPPPGTTVLVGGATADFVDFQSSLTSTCRSRWGS